MSHYLCNRALRLFCSRHVGQPLLVHFPIWLSFLQASTYKLAILLCHQAICYHCPIKVSHWATSSASRHSIGDPIHRQFPFGDLCRKTHNRLEKHRHKYRGKSKMFDNCSHIQLCSVAYNCSKGKLTLRCKNSTYI